MTFKLAQFEGPLDLLLHLVSKHKMDLYDINIVTLIDQYVALVHGAQDSTMENASEFIEMAARLVQMKSFLLLPRSEEAERMRAELTGLLVEYSLCKVIAQQLGAMASGVHTAVREPMVVEFDETYGLQHDVFLLEQAYHALQGRSFRKRQPKQEQFEPIVQAPFVSVGSRIIYVLRGLLKGKVKKLTQLFGYGGNRSQTVATFLAVLELVRAGRVTIGEDEAICISRKKAQSNFVK